MKTSTKLIMLGATGAAALGSALAVRHLRAKKFARNLEAVLSDLDSELDDPVIVSDEIIVVTEAGPYAVEMELVPPEDIDPDAYPAK